jgi:hypothetical protein
MMATVPCNLTAAYLWECNNDLDQDAYPLIAFRPLAVSGRDEHHVTHHDYLNFYVLRLDGNEA